MRFKIKQTIQKIINDDTINFSVEIPKEKKFGDFSTNIAMILAKKLKKIADKVGIEFFCSAFYPDAIEFLEKLKVKRYKIASRTCLLKDPYSLETLQEKALTKKPVIISMGMGGNRKKPS